jgi:hypothetical protein
LNSPEFLETWNQWERHRREIKKPLTTLQGQKQLEKFAEWGLKRSVAAINHTIEKGWQGIREPEGGSGANGQKTADEEWEETKRLGAELKEKMRREREQQGI